MDSESASKPKKAGFYPPQSFKTMDYKGELFGENDGKIIPLGIHTDDFSILEIKVAMCGEIVDHLSAWFEGATLDPITLKGMVGTVQSEFKSASNPNELNPQTTPEDSVVSSALFTVGDRVKLNPDSEYEYEIAEIRRFPHGFMVGIYDEPPSKHVDFWNAASISLVTNHQKP